MQKLRLYLFPALKYAALPLLAAIYPALFHYANNARLVPLVSLLQLCLFLAGLGLALYLLAGLVNRGKFSQAALGAVALLAFFHLYGPVFDGLRALDLLQVETYNFMPFYLFVALYVAWAVMKLNLRLSSRVWQGSLLLVGVLTAFNVVKSVPAEIEKYQDFSVARVNTAVAQGEVDTVNHYPDIYYLIFDEAAGFEVARQYWHYNVVDDFVAFLKTNDFYVAEKSYGSSTNTLREIATRLNYEAIGDKDFTTYNEATAQNRVMADLRAYGYTLIAYDERRFAYPTTASLPVDYLIEEAPEQIASNSFNIMDDYKSMVLQNTLLRRFVFISTEPKIRRHLSMILYSTEMIASDQMTSPKFVYAHILLPHAPFAYSENGRVSPIRTEHVDWQKYFDNYKFSLQVMHQMVENILAAADPENPPVIILQSDHGARNIENSPYTGNLENYPEEYKTWIINAMYLPGCDDAPLSQDMDPINTFPIVFNCYFEANIPLQ